jgi:hypothetical protein
LKLRLSRSGGQLGTSRVLVDVDTARLGSEQRERLESDVERARLFNLRGELTPGVVTPDGFGYELTAESDDGRSTSVSFSLGSAPEAIRALVSSLRSLSSR